MTTVNDERTDREEGSFLTQVRAFQEVVRRKVGVSAATDAHGSDVGPVVEVLNSALTTELLCEFRYKRYFFAAECLNAKSTADEFLQRAAEEADHADMIAARIRQLGCEPDFDLGALADVSFREYRSSIEIEEMIREGLEAERLSISAYGEIIGWLGESDLATKRLLEEILAMEEEHADDMLALLSGANY